MRSARADPLSQGLTLSWRGEGLAKQVSPASVCAAAFVTGLVVRSPGLFTRPRLWGEEAWVYMAAMQDGHPLDALTFVFRKNFQLLTNLFSAAAVSIPAAWSAHATTYLSGLVALYAAVLLGRFVFETNGSRTTAAIVGALLAFQVGGYEVFLNATNVQWVCAISVLFLAQLRLSDRSLGFRVTNVAWVVVCGLTGVPSDVAGFVMGLEAFRQRSGWHLLYACLLGLCGVAQAGILVFGFEPSARPMAFSAETASAFFMQTVFVHLVGLRVADAFGRHFRSVDSSQAKFVVVFALVSLSFLACCLDLARGIRGRALVLLAGWLVVTAVYTFGALTGVAESVSGLIGGRYFLFGSLCLMLILVAAAGLGSPGRSAAAQAVLALMLVIAVNDRFTTHWGDAFFQGSSVPEQVEACAGTRPCPLYSWPAGTAAPPVMLERP